MKRLFLILIALLTIVTTAYAIQTNFATSPGPNTTPADIETKPDKYYDPQQQLRDSTPEMMPNVNVPGDNHY